MRKSDRLKNMNTVVPYRGIAGFKDNIHEWIKEIFRVEFQRGRHGEYPLIHYVSTSGRTCEWCPTFDGSSWKWLEYDGIMYETPEDYAALAVKVEQERVKRMLDDL